MVKHTLMILWLLVPMLSVLAQVVDKDPLLVVMSERHSQATRGELEELVGGADVLVPRLLELRLYEAGPYVAVRAERLLLAYAEREEVSAALEADLLSPKLADLAKTVTVHLDEVEHDEIRRNFAMRAIERAKTERSFIPYAKNMKESSDEEIRKLTRKAFD